MIRRLLLVGGGGGSFVPPVATTFELVAAPGAAWPRGQAFYYAGHSYIASGNDAGGYRIIVFRHSDGTVFNRQLVADGSDPIDQHNAPGICRRESDNRLFTVRGEHSGPNMYVKVSTDSLDTDPTLANGWGTQTNINSQVAGAGSYTYMYPMDISGAIWIFYRDQDGEENWKVSSSSDAGDAADDASGGWSTGASLFRSENASGRAVRSSTSRIDFIACDGSSGSPNSSIYHFYYDGTWRNSAGSSMGSPPFDFTDFTEVWDGGAFGKPGTGFSVAKVGTEIALTWMVDMGSDDDYWYGLWDGATWDTNVIVANVGQGGTFQNGMCFVDPLDLTRVVVSRKPGADPFAIYRYTTANGGTSWSSALLYSDATEHTLYPTFVQDHAAGLEWVALTGEFLSETDFSFALLGYG